MLNCLNYCQHFSKIPPKNIVSSDAMFVGEPVGRLQDGNDVITGPGGEAGSRVLNHLEFMEGLGGDAVQKGKKVGIFED